jgi:hypothetical protein
MFYGFIFLKNWISSWLSFSQNFDVGMIWDSFSRSFPFVREFFAGDQKEFIEVKRRINDNVEFWN